MANERLIDLFAEQQRKDPFAFTYENLNIAMRTFLANGRIPPGTVLPPYPLANALSVSRTTILKSLSCLMEENWVTLNEKNRYIAVKPTMKEIKDILIFRETIEPAIVRLAIKNINEQRLEELHVLLKGFWKINLSAKTTEDEIRHFVEVDLDFHDKLAEICDNSYLERSWQINRSRITQQIWITYKSACDSLGFPNGYSTESPYLLHQQLFNAIQDKNEQIAMGSIYTQARNLNLQIYEPYTA